jgi:hypothetical protein
VRGGAVGLGFAVGHGVGRGLDLRQMRR